MMDQQNILEIDDLSVEFATYRQKVTAVNHANIQLRRGETVGIVGESGSGKSVTSLALMRLIPSPPGRIPNGRLLFRSPSLGEVDLLRLTEAQMRQIRGNEIAMIFQEPMTSLNPVFTCGDQVVETLVLHQKLTFAEAKARTIALFEEVKLPRPAQIFTSYPHQISGGQKQRVMIAMAMACNPAILIADEPTTALDVTVQKTILELMQDLRAQHQMSMFFITHDLGVIAEIADRVVVMYKGNIVEQGPVRDIFAAPQHPYTRGLLACRPRMDVRLRVLPTVADFMTEDGQARPQATENQVSNASEINNTPNGGITVEQALQRAVVTEADYRARQDKLRAQAPILDVQHLKTYFPIRSGFLSKTTGFVKAVDDVSLQVYPGETLGLVGESGCGKTTLGRTLLRLIEPTAGKITFQGQELTTLSMEEMRRVRRDFQIIFQDPYGSLNPRMSVGEAILEPLQVHKLLDNDKQRKERVIQLLERVNLKADHYDRYPHEFSGGQRQRICIARTLALKPRFIICDESVSALDVSVQAQVLNLLNELREELGLTYIFISHDLSVVKFMADRLMVMNNGQVVESGYSDDVYANPTQDYTRKLIDAIPRGRLQDIEAALDRRARA